MSPKLTISNLTKSFGNLKVLENINIHVKTGEFVSIVGPSGCGKTTLFDIIANVEKQTRGEITINNGEARYRMVPGYMLQNPLLLPWRTVLENILLGVDIVKKPRKETTTLALDLLKQFGLFNFANYFPFALSGGMKQRVALLRTVLFCKDFLLLDEPFGALDALTRFSCQMWLLDVCKTFNSSVLFITHDIKEAIFLSDRIYVMNNFPGKIIKEIQVDLPRPRTIELLTSKKAEDLEKKLLKLLI